MNVCSFSLLLKEVDFFFNVSKEEQSDYIIDGAVESEIAGSVYSFCGGS